MRRLLVETFGRYSLVELASIYIAFYVACNLHIFVCANPCPKLMWLGMSYLIATLIHIEINFYVD